MKTPQAKTEMWRGPPRRARAPLWPSASREPVSRDRLFEAARSGENRVSAQLGSRPAKAIRFFIPAGTIHAVGAGLTLCEVQQLSDVTYRLYDYGRPP